MSVFDDVDELLLEYMLWRMYEHSKDIDRMEYGRIIQLLDDRPSSSKIKPKESVQDDYSDDEDNDLNDIRNLLPNRKDSQSFEESPRPKETA